jgi:hypothetical protein
MGKKKPKKPDDMMGDKGPCGPQGKACGGKKKPKKGGKGKGG